MEMEMECSSKPEFRSVSLPLRLSTPIQTHLTKIKALNPSANIQTRLECLVNLYLSIDESIFSSQIQQPNLKVLVEDALIWSTGLLGSYAKIAELLTLMKENVRTLRSALRRKGIDAAHILDYIVHRKAAKKNILNILQSLEQMKKETHQSCCVSGEDQQFCMVIGVVREAVTATCAIFRALLLCLSGKIKPVNRFSFITKLMPVGYDKEQEIINDNDMIDVALHHLRKRFKINQSKTIDVQMVMQKLVRLDSQIEGYEVGLGSLFRRLIQTRVSLLNLTL